MAKIPFIFSPTYSWLGEGIIKLSMVTEELGFFTRWRILPKDELGRIECLQEVQVKGLAEIVHNQFIFLNFTPSTFDVILENHAIGKVSGSGLIKEDIIGWEIKVDDIGFEGYEFYHRQPDQSYLMRAEYATKDEFRTVIQGRIWQKGTEQE